MKRSDGKSASKERSKVRWLIGSMLFLTVYEAALAVYAQHLLKKDREAR
ncbi:MAG: hypothetical protein IJH91_06240 [Mogibacterium sp.]|nr:hypothetical protein [Mogibacterium sp.]